jgi:hypothetical protein
LLTLKFFQPTARLLYPIFYMFLTLKTSNICLKVLSWELSRGREVVWRRQRLSVVPPVVRCCVLGMFFGFNHKLWLMFRSRHLILWSLGTYGLWESR